ncbi:MAG: hypothetical protein QM705_02725 [Ancrocorticia sp.]
MANRSYLYAADSYPGEPGEPLQPRNLIGIAQWNWEVPGLAEQLITINAKICESTIWEGPYAIVADFDAGVELGLAMLDQITHPEAAEYVDEARKALTTEGSRRRYFIFEPAEVFDMIADVEPIEQQVQDLCSGLSSPYGGPDYFIKRVNSATEENRDKVFREAGLYGLWHQNLYFAPVDAAQAEAAARAEKAAPAPEVSADVAALEDADIESVAPVEETAPVQETPVAEATSAQHPVKPGFWQRLFGRK